jgi:hypothetical protein
MLIVVSPYHLTTREPAAMASLLLAEGVVTMLPAPHDAHDRTRVEQTAAALPNYLRFMESWRWTLPLWREGVIGSAIEGEQPASEVRRAYRRIASEPDFATLRALMKQELFENEDTYLDAVSRDVLRAGPDPGITVPVAAGLDAFAAKFGAGVARSEPASVVQRAEARLGQRVLGVAIPVLLQASARKVLLARRALRESLDPLRSAMADIPVASGDALRDAVGQVNLAAREYSAAFNDVREELLAPDEDDEDDDIRVVEGTASITGLLLPADAALRASLSALRALTPAGIAEPSRALPADDDERPLEKPHETARVKSLTPGRSVFTLLIKALGRAPRRM